MSTTERVLGQVKWFNNKAGYGFITLNDSDGTGKDIFAHYTSIRVTNSQYKYLTQGEYVEFTLDKSSSDKHELQANDISGVSGGKLMCEVRRSTVPHEGERRPYRRYSPEEREGNDGDEGFKRVQRRRPAPRKPRVEAN
jgi:hypothetical protein